MSENLFIEMYKEGAEILRGREEIPSLFAALRDGDILHTEHGLGVRQV